MTSQNRLADKCILVVDDQAFMRNTISMILDDYGFKRVLTAEHGQQALKLLKAFTVDLVITDIQMEPVNGLELLKTIRTNGTKLPASMPVIVLSGHSERHVVGIALQLDADAFAVKPVKAEDILQKIDRCFTKPSQLKGEAKYQYVDTAFDKIVAADDVPEPEDSDEVERNADTIEDNILHQRMSTLSPGMVLAKPLLSASGKELMPKNAELSISMVLRLKDLSAILGDKRVEVYKPTQ